MPNVISSRLLRAAVFAILAFAFPLNSFSDIYYVRKDGSDANSGRSADRAFATIKKAALVVQSGDTVYVGIGRYADHVEVRTVRPCPLPVRFFADVTGNDTDVRPTATEEDVVFENNSELRVEDSDGIEFYGFRFEGNSKAEWKESTNCRIDGCTFLGINDKISLDKVTMTIDGCEFLSIRDVGVKINGNTSEVIIRNTTIAGSEKNGIQIDKAKLVRIEDSIIRDNGDHGIKAKSDSPAHKLVIERCQITGNRNDGIHLHDKLAADVISTVIARNGKNGVRIHDDKQPIALYRVFEMGAYEYTDPNGSLRILSWAEQR